MKKPKTQPVALVPEMLVSVVLDRSGSMSSNTQGTIDGYNEFLNGLSKDKDTKFNVSLTQFDSPHQGPELTVSYADTPLANVPKLTKETYEPRGSTPLYDAIGECIRRVDAKGRPVMIVIITDGQENASREFNNEQIKKLIHDKEGEGWKFVFLGADIDSFAVGGSLGIASANVANYTKGFEKDLYGTVAMSATLHASNVRAHGMTRSTANMDTIGHENRMKMVDDPAKVVTGGRPAVPSTFPKKGTKWAVRDKVSDAGSGS